MNQKGSTGLIVLIFIALVVAASVMWFMRRNEMSNSVPTPLSPIEVMEESVTVTGEIVCLPHEVNEAQTTECLLGLRTAGNVYYDLLDTTPNRSHTITAHAHVTVSGILRDAEWNNDFVTSGTIEIQAIEPVVENNKL
ncbi:MAG: hypothetical protein G01um101448_759 [Parcubacteria group bacterium Gr01-1014_48]|nr:MAG: hypothetical protein Greene041614_933 [Parcubacteria group bacterium Greene0416_14]TSC73447.1 MAG: hypothetical protein G01um101448_759 [Parcubacteria group bacterium Gr01-1014_48]TSD00043.1 MAG: hypothetical protein Greene101415_989 [Parcubacteria group bacterium Greene1014_15]TSD07399.1 MAG: hypothetical protein Greene07144_917 [Parcubacteria group bacterium Greene0714_4]